MVVSKQSYEDLRKQRLEENKKRMEELNLPQLTQALKAAHSPKPSAMKRTKPRAIGTEMVEVRRSSRVASSSAPVYKEIVVYERVGLPRRNKMVVSKQSYEDLRKQRLEENKKRMEELNLPQLTQALKAAHSPKPSAMKRAIGTEMVEVRRSSRVASSSARVYKEIVVYERVGLPRSGIEYSYSRKDLANRVYASYEAREYAINKAKELELKLEGGRGHPSFVKSMLQSHVTGGFCLCLPGYFCRKNLPKNDETVTLIDEDGEEFLTVYLACKARLSGGWRGFSISHELVDGDALVFHLIERTVFKVYIIRNKDYYAEGENNDGSYA